MSFGGNLCSGQKFSCDGQAHCRWQSAEKVTKILNSRKCEFWIWISKMIKNDELVGKVIVGSLGPYIGPSRRQLSFVSNRPIWRCGLISVIRSKILLMLKVFVQCREHIKHTWRKNSFAKRRQKPYLIAPFGVEIKRQTNFQSCNKLFFFNAKYKRPKNKIFCFRKLKVERLLNSSKSPNVFLPVREIWWLLLLRLLSTQ